MVIKMADSTLRPRSVDDLDVSPHRNGRAVTPTPGDDGHATPTRSPSPRYRRYSDSTTPTRSPTPSEEHGDDASARCKKSVSFHSHANWKNERKIQSAFDCLQYMMEGSSMVKIRSNSRQYHRYFRLLEDLSAIRWTPTSKKTSKAQLLIEQIKEIRTGRNCESLRHKEMPINYNEERIFSILYGDSYDSIDLIAQSPEEANIWVTGLNALIGASKSPDAVEDNQTLRDTWLKEIFEKATRDATGCIDQTTCIRLIQTLDDKVATVRVKQKLQEFDLTKTDCSRGRIGSQEFVEMFKEIATRPEIYFLMIRYANKDYLTQEDLHLFLEGEQGMSGLDREALKKLIDKYEPAPEARKSGRMLIDGFTKYLLSDDCDAFDPAHRAVCQDMNQPLTHYFISTSHNTYLLEDQLKGPSSVDGYIRVLTCGCRCVKVDVWDGPEEPIVFHGNTLTSKVAFTDVVDVISSYSFDFSAFPVIVHIETHCTIKQQKQMAKILKRVLGNALYVHPKNATKPVTAMSPHELRYKIILKGKRLPDPTASEGDVTEEDEGGEMQDPSRNRRTLCKELASLFSIGRTRYRDLNPAKHLMSRDEMCSVSESAVGKLAHASAEELVNHNKDYLTRVYPNPSRVDSSNYNPEDFWNAGCQLVALNFQTPGQMMDVYEGRFRANGACGYVLKPAVMREHISFFSANSRETIPGVAPQLLKIKIISGQNLPKPSGSTATKASFIDPYVVVQVFGIPADCAETKTRTVSNDSSSPIFDEIFEFNINLPELALVRFVVLDDDYIGDDFIGQYAIPLECLQTGYRHIRLLSSMGEPLDNSTLFVHICISSKKGGGPKQGRSRARKSASSCVDLRPIGLKAADELFRGAEATLLEAEHSEQAVEGAWADLQDECGLENTANMKQCLRVTVSRFLASPGVKNLAIVEDNGVPFVKSSYPGPLPSHLHKLETCFEKVMLEFQYFFHNMDKFKSTLEAQLQPAFVLYDKLEGQLHSHGIKGKKANRAIENYAWNVRVIRGQLDRLVSTDKKCRVAMEQVQSTKVMLDSLTVKERSPMTKERPRLNLSSRHHTAENLSVYGGPGPSPTSPGSASSESKPKSILKKSNSNIESASGTTDPV